jgi:3-phosphoshikimate 1-carboxyvinyltransferase
MSIRTVRPVQARGLLHAPPSKSYTHRALVAAFLAGQGCTVIGPLESEDTQATCNGLKALGARVQSSHRGWKVTRLPRAGQRPRRVIRCGESGTTFRFLSAVAALGSDSVSFEGSQRLATRPMEDLFGALRALGATIVTRSKARTLPCTIRGPLEPGTVSLRGDVSSQFTSALLMVLPTLPGPSRVRLEREVVSGPYIDATCAMLANRHIELHRTRRDFTIPGFQSYRATPIEVPGDASSAAYLWAAGAVTGGSVAVTGISADLPQADLAILSILSRMGCRIDRRSRSIRVSGPLSRPISVDLTDSPDLFPLVAVLASLVPGGRSRLKGAPHLEFKESNRRVGSIRLVRAIGADAVEHPARLEVVGTPAPRPLNLPSLDDHRLVMSAAVAALAGVGASRIGRAEAVAKSFPGFWTDLTALTGGGAPPP